MIHSTVNEVLDDDMTELDMAEVIQQDRNVLASTYAADREAQERIAELEAQMRENAQDRADVYARLAAWHEMARPVYAQVMHVFAHSDDEWDADRYTAVEPSFRDIEASLTGE